MKHEFLEICGKMYGMVVSKDENTLLVRKAITYYRNDEEVCILKPVAVYIDKSELDNYWVRLFDRDYLLEAVNCIDCTNLISELSDV